MFHRPAPVHEKSQERNQKSGETELRQERATNKKQRSGSNLTLGPPVTVFIFLIRERARDAAAVEEIPRRQKPSSWMFRQSPLPYMARSEKQLICRSSSDKCDWVTRLWVFESHLQCQFAANHCSFIFVNGPWHFGEYYYCLSQLYYDLVFGGCPCAMCNVHSNNMIGNKSSSLWWLVGMQHVQPLSIVHSQLPPTRQTEKSHVKFIVCRRIGGTTIGPLHCPTGQRHPKKCPTYIQSQ